jgi:oligopeptide transport system ATP-binding protein
MSEIKTAPPAGSDGVLIEAAGLCKHFPILRGIFKRQKGTVKAVDGVDFSIRPGETLGLVGESGCGKTTVARMVLRLETPTGGAVLFRGQKIATLRGDDLRRYRRGVQAVLQDPYTALNPRLTVGRTVSEPLTETNKKVSKKEVSERVAEALTSVGLLPRIAKDYPHELSGGQRQRVEVARAIITRPECIVLDEPVSAADVSVRAEIINLLQDVQDDLGVSYLLISHDLAVVQRMCHRIAVMYLGKFVEVGAAREISARPLHPYTQVLLSNALPSHPDDVGEEILLAGEVPSPRNVPPGCPFHPRCPIAAPLCREAVPVLSAEGTAHEVACHLVDRAGQATGAANQASIVRGKETSP